MHIREFQNMMQQIYFHRDSERGATGTYNWLVDEVKELGQALEGDTTAALEEEFADVLAWLASLANVLDVDLEDATLSKYSNKCPKCRKTPCQCSLLK